MDKKISISQIKEVVQQAYEQVKGNTGGKNADYIPYLANIDKTFWYQCLPAERSDHYRG